MEEDHIALSRAVLALCQDHADAPRALAVSLSALIARVQYPATVAALAIREISEAAIRAAEARLDLPPPRRRKAKANVVSLAAVRRRRRDRHVPGEPV